MLEVADEERAAAAPRPAALAERDDLLARERAQVLLRAEHGSPERMLAEGGAVDQVLGDDRRLVVGAVDLLDDDPALAVELVGVELRPADEVAQQVDRLGRGLGADGDVEGDQVVARVGVQHAAEPLGGLVDVLVGGVLLAALEDQMLEEVSHPVLLGALRARARVERHEHRQRAGARQRDAVDRQPVGRDRGCWVALISGLPPYKASDAGDVAACEPDARTASLRLPAMSSRRRTLYVLAALLPILLVAGVWLGGHPEDLPSFARSSLVAHGETRVIDEAIDQIAQRLLPQGRPPPAGERVDRRCGREPQ